MVKTEGMSQGLPATNNKESQASLPPFNVSNLLANMTAVDFGILEQDLNSYNTNPFPATLNDHNKDEVKEKA